MSKLEYAIVDIETTGGHAARSRITEIAIVVHDGTHIVERFESLVNPEMPIPFPITALTGITDEMVNSAPGFDEIAHRVYELLEGRVFVAHHVNFDYSFVRDHLEKNGYKWTAKKLCTVRLARKLRPGLSSYSLGRLCDRLEIPISHRHRAGGDADATTILFEKLLGWDTEGIIGQMLKKTSKEQQLPPHLPRAQYENLPDGPGVYYFHDRSGKPLYVGKAVNLRKRVAAHFTGHNIQAQRQHFLRDIHGVSFERCGTELMALLLECAEIKRLWPPYNRSLKRFEPKFGLFCYERLDGYMQLSVGAVPRHHQCIKTFYNQYEGISLLRKLQAQFELDFRFCSFGTRVPEQDRAGKSTEAEHFPTAAEYNQRVAAALQSLEASCTTYAIVDKGRTEDELSCVWVENATLYGMGYVPKDSDLSSPDDVRDSLTRYQGNHYMMQLISAFASRYPHKVYRPENPLPA